MTRPSCALPIPRRALLLALSAASLLPAGLRAQAAAGAGQADKARGTLVKAAFLHKFSSFVEWPQGAFAKPDSPLRIGVLGDDQVWQDLVDLSHDRDRDGRPVQAVRLAEGESFAGLHILYIKTSSVAKMVEILPRVPEGVLTVADADGAHPRGSVMSFFTEDGRVRFGVSVDAATRQKLKLSSRLLAVARNVQGALEPLFPPESATG